MPSGFGRLQSIVQKRTIFRRIKFRFGRASAKALSLVSVVCTCKVSCVLFGAGHQDSSTAIFSEAKIGRYPEPIHLSGNHLGLISIPKFDQNSTDPWQIDWRSQDLTKIDMTASLPDLMYADFDNRTRWPTADKVPAAYSMEMGHTR